MSRFLLFVVVGAVAIAEVSSAKVMSAPADPVAKNCGPEPAQDPAAKAGIARAERALQKIKSNQSKVFAAYRRQYDENRKQIIARNKRLPKSQHLAVPPKRTDTQLEASAEYKKRLRDVGADAAAETAAKQSINQERQTLASKQNTFAACKNLILKRMRTASTRPAAELLAIPAASRLAEEVARLQELKRIHEANLDTKRKSKEMGPILSAGICARQDLQKAIDSKIRATKKAARASGTDASAEISTLQEERRSHELEVIELKRDFKLLKLRRSSCRSRAISALTTCVSEKIQAPETMPGVCMRKFEDELELLGLWAQPFE